MLVYYCSFELTKEWIASLPYMFTLVGKCSLTTIFYLILFNNFNRIETVLIVYDVISIKKVNAIS